MSDLDLKKLWQSDEPDDGPTMDLESVKKQAQAFERKIRRRNALEWIASAFVVVFFGTDALDSETTAVAVGNTLIALAAIGISVYLWRKGRVELNVDPTMDAMGFAEAQAGAMEEQARLLAWVPLWYLGPLAVGMVVLMIGRFPTDGRGLVPWALTAGVVAVVFAGVAWLNIRGARKLRTQAGDLRAEID
jgi:hypothetical protein